MRSATAASARCSPSHGSSGASPAGCGRRGACPSSRRRLVAERRVGEGAPRRVSVVMATYRREELLRAALEDVLALKYPELEIIVVDQTPEHTPATRALLASVADHVRLIHQARPHVVTALNAGLAAARGEIVLFLDDDIRITDPDFVGAHAKNYDDPRVGGVAGRVIDARTRAEGRYDARSADPVFGFFHTSWNHRTRATVYSAPGANMSFRREALVRLGGFDERFVGNAFRFENDLVLRLSRAGYRCCTSMGARAGARTATSSAATAPRTRGTSPSSTTRSTAISNTRPAAICRGAAGASIARMCSTGRTSSRARASSSTATLPSSAG
ncbi:MAG: hypothetical protein DME11_05785 [Candidatus Rokuibacteriota bacterium]|nr:MAG: hypothetical protein DME11_05785 [Candidatus Rokubacteria bacterium]